MLILENEWIMGVRVSCGRPLVRELSFTGGALAMLIRALYGCEPYPKGLENEICSQSQ